MTEGADQFIPVGKRPEEGTMTTDPYRPQVGASPPDDTPLEVKSSEELPAGNDWQC
jgi:hypothetical protein